MQAQIDAVRGQMLIKTIVLSSIKEILSNKKQIIWDHVKRLSTLSKSKSDWERSLKDALDPIYQSQQIVVHLALFLRDQLPLGEIRDKQNFRVAFYVTEHGFLKPFGAFDLARQSYQFLHTFNEYESHFNLKCINRPSHAVRCIVEDQTLIVEDCSTEIEELHPNQFRYLKSMVAYPIKRFESSSDHGSKACIVVDTDMTGHFKKKEILEIETYMEQFAVRLDLEFSVHKLLAAKSTNPGRGSYGSTQQANEL